MATKKCFECLAVARFLPSSAETVMKVSKKNICSLLTVDFVKHTHYHISNRIWRWYSPPFFFVVVRRQPLIAFNCAVSVCRDMRSKLIRLCRTVRVELCESNWRRRWQFNFENEFPVQFDATATQTCTLSTIFRFVSFTHVVDRLVSPSFIAHCSSSHSNRLLVAGDTCETCPSPAVSMCDDGRDAAEKRKKKGGEEEAEDSAARRQRQQ